MRVPALLFDLDGTLVDSLYVLACRRPLSKTATSPSKVKVLGLSPPRALTSSGNRRVWSLAADEAHTILFPVDHHAIAVHLSLVYPTIVAEGARQYVGCIKAGTRRGLRPALLIYVLRQPSRPQARAGGHNYRAVPTRLFTIACQMCPPEQIVAPGMSNASFAERDT